MKPTAPSPIATPIGILLAAGKGTRFDASGQRNKLLAPLRQGAEIGLPVGFVAARRMRNALSRVIAIIDADSPQRDTLTEWFRKAGCEVVATPYANAGMGASLAHAVRASLMPSQDAEDTDVADDAEAPEEVARIAPQGWIIALADMPKIAPATIQTIALALTQPGDASKRIVAPVFEGQRGHPVGIGPEHGAALMALTGDQGARALIDTHGFSAIDTLDAGVVLDIDQAHDLE